MPINFLLLNYNKTEVPVLGPHAARKYAVLMKYATPDSLSVTSYSAVKQLGVIIIISEI